MKFPLRIMVALGVLSLGCAVTEARVGETEKQWKDRYGEPLSSGLFQGYKQGEVAVLAHFHEGICDYILFFKIEGVRRFSDDDRDSLFKTYGGERRWRKSSGNGIMDVFKTEDGELLGEHDVGINSMRILSSEAAKRRDERKAEQEKKRDKS